MIRQLKRLHSPLFQIISALLFLAPGCAWIPPGNQSAKFMEAPDMSRTIARYLDGKEASSSQSWPKEQWWQEFGSLELNRLIETALKDNPGLKAAAARLHQAQALARMEGARLLPFLDADAEAGYQRYSGNGLVATLNNRPTSGSHLVFGKLNLFNLRYEFDFWGKNRADLEAALGEAAANEAEMADVRLRLITAIARSYFHGLALRHQLDLTQDMVALHQNLLAVCETRLSLGLDSADPVKESAIGLERVKQREALTQGQLNLQRNLLAKLTGKEAASTQHLFTDKASIPHDPVLPDKLPLELLRHRPDLASALFRAEAAAQRVKAAKAGFLPTIDLTAFAGVNALRMTEGASALANILFSGSSLSYGVAPGLRLPWFEGGRLRAGLSAQRAEYDNSVELYNDTLLHAVQEVADNLSNWKESRSMLEAHNRLLFSQRKNKDLAEARFRSGLNDRRELLDRQQKLLDQEYALKTLEAGHLAARVNLIEALGGGYSKEIAIVRQLIRHEPEHPSGFDLYKWLIL